MVFLDFIFDPVFSPLLRLPLIVAIPVISFVITLIITLVYMKFTDQSLMKSLKEEIKSYQVEMKKYRDDPEKLMKVNKKAMEANMKYMTHSFKPTLITLIPILLIFSWLNAHFTYQPLIAGQEFDITAQFKEGALPENIAQIELIPPQGGFTLLSDAKPALNNSVKDEKVLITVWKAKAEAGTYTLKYSYDGKQVEQQLRVNVDKTDKLYEPPSLNKAELTSQGLPKDAKLQSITLGNERVRPFGESFSLFSWHPGWLATYILFSIIFSMGLRKLLKVY
jgi:uncharacterized membrane protein (DUF106 family)